MNAMIYLDYQATTPADGRVVEAMQPFHELEFGNPHSIQHSAGQSAAEAVEKARAQVAALIGADPREIVFTSGATESNNLAIKGTVTSSPLPRNTNALSKAAAGSNARGSRSHIFRSRLTALSIWTSSRTRLPNARC